MALDAFGKIAAVEIVFYIPVVFTSLFVVFRNGFSRREGWIFLCTFSLIRIVGAAITVATKTESNPSTGLFTAAAILSAIGLSPLLLATLGFVSKVSEHGVSDCSIFLRLIRLVLTVGLILGIVGGSDAASATASDPSSGRTFTRVATLLFLASYVALLALQGRLWSQREHIPPHHRTLLKGIAFTSLPLLVRILYSILSAFASSPRSRWSSTFGDWKIYLVMGVIMEYIVVCIYVIIGAFTPLKEEEQLAKPRPETSYSKFGLLELGELRGRRRRF